MESLTVDLFIQLLTLQIIVDLLARSALTTADQALAVLTKGIERQRGMELMRRLRRFRRRLTLAGQLLDAAQRASECFIRKCDVDFIRSTERMAPLAGTESLSDALFTLPDSFDEEGLHKALTDLFNRTWPNIQTRYREEAVQDYLSCLRSSLTSIPEYRDRIIAWAVLRARSTPPHNHKLAQAIPGM